MPRTRCLLNEIEKQFRGLTEDLLGATRVRAVLDQLWRLEEVDNIAETPSAFALD